jgi:quinol-cytochrome oxidoreductase complex cytochrome b subunit
MRPSFFHHLHPPTIPAAQSRWRYTLGAGGTAVFLMLVLGVTGILELFYYIPTPEEAALSVQRITYHVPFGGFIRNLHYWSAQLLMVVSAIHLLRVVFTAAYRSPRRFNYLLGMTLFLLSILLNFTGYVLRWDVDICYPLLTGTNLLKTIPFIGDVLYRLAVGGGDACETGLLRFFIWHIFGLTIVAFVVMIWHGFRVRRDGGIAVPPPQLRLDSTRISRNELVQREVLAMFVVGIFLIVLSSLVPAPIAAAMAESHRTGETSAPWFFLWIQQMLRWGDPLMFGILVPLGILLLVSLIPYIFPQPVDAEVGRWFPKSNRLAQVMLTLIVLSIIVLTLIANAN